MLEGGRYLQFEPDPAAVSAEERGKWNPLSLLAHERQMPFLVEWISMLAGQRGYHVSSDDRTEIETALKAARSRNDKRFWRLQTVYTSLPKNSPLAKELQTWVGSAVDAHYFDNVEDSFDETEWVTIATDKILSNKSVARPFLSYATYRIRDSLEQRRARGDLGPTIIMLPEIWNLLDDEAFARQIGGCIVMMRALLGSVWMDAQTPEQVSSSSIWPAIRDNVAIRVFVPVKDFKPETKRAYERDFGQSEAQIKAIGQCKPKKDYFITEDGGMSRRVSGPPAPESEAILRSESSSQVLLDRHMRSGDPNWKQNYLREAIERIRQEKLANREEEEAAHAEQPEPRGTAC